MAINKRISLKDIAQKVGVSTALVSYVLNNKKEGRINKDVAQKIRDTAKELNYRTNLLARSLKTNKTYTIGLIVADISSATRKRRRPNLSPATAGIALCVVRPLLSLGKYQLCSLRQLYRFLQCREIHD